MKHSDIYVKNGIIFNEIANIIKRARLAKKQNLLVLCNDEEVFDESMKTIMNRYPNAIGLVLIPNPGAKMGKRDTVVKFYDELQGLSYTIEIMTKEQYEAQKEVIDAKTYDVKHTIMWTGGEN